jgi:integrase
MTALDSTETLNAPEVLLGLGLRISPVSEPLKAGSKADDDIYEKASLASSVVKRPKDTRGRFLRLRNPLGHYPFTAIANRVLEETAPWYSAATQKERIRKMHRIHTIVQELRESGLISTSSPKSMTEADVVQFISWCKTHLDNSTSLKYVRYLDEVLRAAGNASIASVRLKHRQNLPKATSKPIRTLAQDQVDRLLGTEWTMEDPFIDAMAKGAIALYLHTGMRPSELRLAKLKDLDLARQEIIVSSPKGQGAWASGTETAPMMPGADLLVRAYLEARADHLRTHGIDPGQAESLFPYITEGKANYWSQAMWGKFKHEIEIVSGVRFRFKDLRPTFGQLAKDKGAPIEVVSKCLRHSSTKTTETWYARIRSENAFSQLRRLWEAPTQNPQIAD